jgi:hypothetical protein
MIIMVELYKQKWTCNGCGNRFDRTCYRIDAPIIETGEIKHLCRTCFLAYDEDNSTTLIQLEDWIKKRRVKHSLKEAYEALQNE